MVGLDDFIRKSVQAEDTLRQSMAELAALPERSRRRRSRVAQRIGKQVIAHHIECERRLWPCVRECAPASRDLVTEERAAFASAERALCSLAETRTDASGSKDAAVELADALNRAFHEEGHMCQALREAIAPHHEQHGLPGKPRPRPDGTAVATR